MTKKEEFLMYAESQCGENGGKFWSSVGSPKNMPWSASFITSCAKHIGICDSILPNTSNSNSYADKGKRTKNPGRFLPGKALGGMNLPESGDVILFGTGEDSVDRIGIVRSYDQNTGTMKVILGDSSKSGHDRSIVSMASYDPTYNEIVGYFRPDWGSAG